MTNRRDGFKIFILTIVIGAILLAIFKTTFPEIPSSEVVRVIGLASFGLALLFNYLWMRSGKKGRKKEEDP